MKDSIQIPGDYHENSKTKNIEIKLIKTKSIVEILKILM